MPVTVPSIHIECLPGMYSLFNSLHSKCLHDGIKHRLHLPFVIMFRTDNFGEWSVPFQPTDWCWGNHNTNSPLCSLHTWCNERQRVVRRPSDRVVPFGGLQRASERRRRQRVNMRIAPQARRFWFIIAYFTVSTLKFAQKTRNQLKFQSNPLKISDCV